MSPDLSWRGMKSSFLLSPASERNQTRCSLADSAWVIPFSKGSPDHYDAPGPQPKHRILKCTVLGASRPTCVLSVVISHTDSTRLSTREYPRGLHVMARSGPRALYTIDFVVH